MYRSFSTAARSDLISGPLCLLRKLRGFDIHTIEFGRREYDRARSPLKLQVQATKHTPGDKPFIIEKWIIEIQNSGNYRAYTTSTSHRPHSLGT